MAFENRVLSIGKKLNIEIKKSCTFIHPNKMEMKILNQTYGHALISANDLEKICESHEAVEFEKNDFFLKLGQVAGAYYVIEEGFVRSYLIDLEGNEVTTKFAGPGELIIEVSSLFQRVPAMENIQALTSGRAYRIGFDAFQALFHEVEGFREWGRAWMSQQIFAAKTRTADMYTKTASRRYQELIEERPELLSTARLKHIATYLGITDTSLSRIRREG